MSHTTPRSLYTWGLGLSLGLQMACGASQPAEPQVAHSEPEPAPAPAQAVAEVDASQRWDELVDELIEETFRANPTFAASQGRHEYDGKVPDLSSAGIAAEIERLEQRKDQVENFDAAELDEERAFEHKYVLSSLDYFLFWLKDARKPERNPLFYSSVIDPSMYLTLPYAPLEQRMRGYTDLAAQIPTVLGHMRENLETPLPRTFVEVAVKIFGGLGPYLKKDVPAVFAEVQDEQLQKEFAEANAKAAAALAEATQWLEGLRKSADDSYALGPELFSRMLWMTERVDVPLAELEAVGQQDMERNLEALRKACDKLTGGKPIAKCISKVQNDKPKQGPVQAARDQLDGLKAFVQAEQLVSIPGTEEARVEEAPPYKRWNSAYIEIPGPYEENLPSTYYIAPPDPSWSKKDRLAYIPGETDLLFTSVHEVWPGHFLQFLHANRAGRMFGRLFVGYAFAEGWAHYSEELVWEAGLRNDEPAVHVGQLLNALLRNARFLSAIGLHTKGMSVAESEKLFREKAFQDPGNARQQAARGTFDPAYLNYTMGKLMIRKMRADWTQSRGGRESWKAFHDKLLSFGGPPLPLVRQAMLGDGQDLF